MRRLKEAGLNPHLMYGNGAEANRSGMINPEAPETANYNVRPGFNPLELIGAYQQVQQRQATHDLTRKNIEVQEQNKSLAGVRELLESAKIAGAAADSKTKMEIAKRSAEVQDAALKLKLQNLENELKRGANLDQDFDIKTYLKKQQSAKANIEQKDWQMYKEFGVTPSDRDWETHSRT